MMTTEKPDEKNMLPEDVQRLLVRCEGFIDLKMPDRAEQELALVDEAYHGRLYFRWLRISALVLRKNWAEAHPLASALRRDYPDEAGFWIQDAYVTRRAVDIDSARSILEEARNRFPDEGVIYYNLACYACRLGNPVEAEQLLKSAIDIDEKWLATALEDEDLAEIHEKIEDWTC